MVTRVVQPNSERAFIKEGGSPSDQANVWLKLITDRALIFGTGDPEGVVEARKAAIYMDEAGTAGNILYIKRDADIGGDTTLGWILV